MGKKGLTLMEILVVLTILGVLVSIALPRMTAQVDSSEAGEAMAFLGSIKRAAMGCYDMTGNFELCSTSQLLSVYAPGGTKFSYFHSAPTSSDTNVTWWARAKRNTSNVLMLNLTNHNSATVATNASPFVGVVNKIAASTAFVPVSSTVY